MRYFSLIFSLLLLYSINSFSQDKVSKDYIYIDDANYKVIYSYKYYLDSTNLEKPKKNNMVLLIGEKMTSFISEFKYLGDSLWNANGVGLIKGNVFKKIESISAKPGINYQIIKEKSSDKFKYYQKNIGAYWEIDDKVSLKWKLTNESEVINGVNCSIANVKFRGRNYKAWYAPEIPIFSGPYKFYGLPGLIIKIEDTQQTHIFEMLMITKYNGPIIRKKGKTIKYEICDLPRLQKNYDREKFERAKGWFADDQQFLAKYKKKLYNRNNHIELILDD